MGFAKWKILLVDDDPEVHTTAKRTLADDSRFTIVSAMSGEQAKEILAANPRAFALALVDFNMPTLSGPQTVRDLHRINPELIVAVLSGIDTREAVKQSWEAGAVEFIEKKTQGDQFTEKILSLCLKYEESVRGLDDEEPKTDAQELIESVGLTGASEELAFVIRLALKAAKTDASVLVLGESGTGKELIARLIHKFSKRSAFNFVPVNMSAISHELFESQFFGHMKGSFTGAIQNHIGFFKKANAGTIFLDEIGDIPLSQQAKLLRTLQEGEIQPIGSLAPEKINTRVIAATHVDLEAAIHDGRFRQDLLYRLNVFPIVLPPLRERPKDIRALTRRFRNEYKGQNKVIAPEVLKRFERYCWPGNVRELENEIQRLIAVTSGDRITLKDLHSKFFSKETNIVAPDSPVDFPDYQSFKIYMEEIERKLLTTKLEKFKNIRDAASEGLGISSSTLFSRLKALRISKNQKGDIYENDQNSDAASSSSAVV